MLARTVAGMVPAERSVSLPEVGNPNDFKRAILELFDSVLFQEICAHDYDIVTLGNDPAPVYCCAICDKVGPPVL
jgi:hypothetical protein